MRDYNAEAVLGENHFRRPPAAQRKRDDYIKKLQEDFVGEIIGVRSFLDRASHLTEPDVRMI